MDDQITLNGFEAPEHNEKQFLQGIRSAINEVVEASGGDANLITVTHTKPSKFNSGGYTAVKFGNITAFRLKLRGKQQYISIPVSLVDLIPKQYPQRAIKSDQKYRRVIVDVDHPIEAYADFLVMIAGAAVNRYPKDWDCCSMYMECSDAKSCVHPDKAFALSCGYRRILNSGRIFYGANRNID